MKKNYLNASTSSGVSGIFFPKAAGACLGYQIILLIADASEVFVSLHFIVIDKVGELLLALPEIYQFGNKVDARLHGMYKTRLQRNGQTLRLTAELRALGLSVIAHPEFTQILHVMHVRAPSCVPAREDRTKHVHPRARRLRHFPSSARVLSNLRPSHVPTSRIHPYKEYPDEVLSPTPGAWRSVSRKPRAGAG